jgi:hypothetical protein
VPDERRCPSCDALVAADASWCGQCYTSLTVAASAVEEATASAPVTDAVGDGQASATAGASEGRLAYWPCPVCDARNPIENDACVTCGTPFAAVMRSEPERAHVEPKDALAWSLLFPGLGHRKVGRPMDGLARGVLFGLSFGLAVLVGFSGVRSGPMFAVFLLLLLAGLGVYVLSALEAYRLAEGGDLLVPSRVLMWVSVGVVFLAVAMLALAVVTTTRG